jgi:hypothetical protein
VGSVAGFAVSAGDGSAEVFAAEVGSGSLSSADEQDVTATTATVMAAAVIDLRTYAVWPNMAGERMSDRAMRYLTLVGAIIAVGLISYLR